MKVLAALFRPFGIQPLAAGAPGAMPAGRPPQPVLQGNPRVVIKTTLGEIELELDPLHAPISTQNFLGYVRKRFYDGTIFHRVISNFMIQGGGFTADFAQKPAGQGIKNESANGQSNVRGTVAMARTSVPDSASSQFFINVRDNLFLDGQPGKPGYAVFGKVVAGMDVVDKIRVVPTQKDFHTPKGQIYDDVPAKTVLIESVREK